MSPLIIYLKNSFMKPVLFGCSLETVQSLQQTQCIIENTMPYMYERFLVCGSNSLLSKLKMSIYL